jgi:rhodanese-related sulfurtransferase
MTELNKIYGKVFFYKYRIGGGSYMMSFETIRINEINKYINKQGVLIIDLRDKKEYREGHIPTAVNIPYEELEEQKKKLKQYSLLIFYCDRGNISLLAARDLLKAGYNIKSLYGGFNAYKESMGRSL